MQSFLAGWTDFSPVTVILGGSLSVWKISEGEKVNGMRGMEGDDNFNGEQKFSPVILIVALLQELMMFSLQVTCLSWVHCY